MSISFNEETRIFSLETAHQLYQMQIAEGGVLLHLYYGAKTCGDMSYLIRMAGRGFSGNPYEQRMNRGFSLDTLPQEYASSGVGDYHKATGLECLMGHLYLTGQTKRLVELASLALREETPA